MTIAEPTVEVEAECLGLAHGGAMICQVTAGEQGLVGKKAFVPGLIPGERARVAVLEDKKSFLVGSLLEVINPSPNRIQPPCPVFARCGGCDLQYMPIADQRELKREMFEKTLQRQAGLVLPGAVQIIGADLPSYGYRKRISLHLNLQGELGFFSEGSGQVVPFSECAIASAAINQCLPVLQKLAGTICPQVAGITVEEFSGRGVALFLLRADLEAHALDQLEKDLRSHVDTGKIFFRDQQMREWHTGLIGPEAIEFSTLRHFSQINQAGNQLLIEKVLSALADQSEVSEFYAGSGNFSFPLARVGKRVDAIEVDQQLIDSGIAQAKLEKLTNLKFIRSSTEHYMQRGDVTLRQSVLLDPPRSGAKILCEDLIPDRVASVVYVSCALPTLARDLATLVRNGFELLEVSVLDMFAQTHHVESISVLRAPKYS